MPNKFWIKQPIGYLYRRDIATLPDWLWRIFHELRMIPGLSERGGLLESVSSCAWELRRDSKQIMEGLQALAGVGLAKETPEGWLLVGFAEEQDALTSTERVQEFRKRQKETGEERHGNDLETERYKDETKNETQLKTESKIDSESLKKESLSLSGPIVEFLKMAGLQKFPKGQENQLAILAGLIEANGAEKTLGCARWLWSKPEMTLARAIRSMQTSVPDWTIEKGGPKTNGNGNGHKPAAEHPLKAELQRRLEAQQNGS
jgi:hypothetical protein